jgi:hypothetical protein
MTDPSMPDPAANEPCAPASPIGTPLEEAVLEECKRYGLETMAGGDPTALFPVLLRHIYGNRDATYGAKDASIAILRERLAAVSIGDAGASSSPADESGRPS